MNPIRSFAHPRAYRSIVAALALALFLAGCGGGKGQEEADQKKDAKAEQTAEASKDGAEGKDGKKKNEEKPIPVEIAQVAKRPIQASYHGTAALEAPNEAQVVAKTSGVLLQLMVEEGDSVKAGQVLARIDPDRPRLELQRAEAMLKKLQAEMARSKELFERKLVAADVFERIRYDVATQQAAYDMAKL
jgi:membrane fusion protein (multidrug efflux system)